MIDYQSYMDTENEDNWRVTHHMADKLCFADRIRHYGPDPNHLLFSLF
jgi:hypothetical protein